MRELLQRRQWGTNPGTGQVSSAEVLDVAFEALQVASEVEGATQITLACRNPECSGGQGAVVEKPRFPL